MHSSLHHLAHRPWPLPSGGWAWRQRWANLLFAHWPVAASALRPLVPRELEIEECEGSSWVGLVPLRMEAVTHRHLPALPGVSAFAELNLRLYVAHRGRPGVWFVSLDAANPLAVWTARRFFHLPYVHAAMQAAEEGDGIRFRSRRRELGAEVAFAGAYRPCGEPRAATPGTLEHFLVERYCLFARSPGGSLWCTDVHHEPWRLQPAEAAIELEQVAAPQGIGLEGPPRLLHFSRAIEVVAWAPRRVA